MFWVWCLLQRAVRALAIAGAAAAVSMAVCVSPALADDGDYHLGPNDKIRVIVYGETDLSGDFQIDATGQVRLPMVGEIHAGGLTARALEGDIAAALGNGYLNNPRVAVEVTAYRPFYVVGEVFKPGEYPFANGLTAQSAVALAGGYTPKAVESVVYVRHQGETAERRVAAVDPIPVRPGDIIRVESTAFWDVIDVLSPLAGVSALRYTVP